MNNRRILLHRIYLVVQPILFIILAVVTIGYFFPGRRVFNGILLYIASGAFSGFGLSVMYLTGKFRRTVWGKLSLVTFALLILASLFKLQHWSGAAALGVAFGISFFALYLLYFIQKTDRPPLDWIKLVFVLVWCGNVCARFLQVDFAVGFVFIYWLVALLMHAVYYNHVLKYPAKCAQADQPVLSEHEQQLFEWED